MNELRLCLWSISIERWSTNDLRLGPDCGHLTRKLVATLTPNAYHIMFPLFEYGAFVHTAYMTWSTQVMGHMSQ